MQSMAPAISFCTGFVPREAGGTQKDRPHVPLALLHSATEAALWTMGPNKWLIYREA